MPVIKFKGLEVVTVTFENRNNCRVFCLDVIDAI